MATAQKERGSGTAPRGFLLTATGPRHRDLARRAAASVRRHHPDIPIDLFTDVAPDDPAPYDRVEIVEDVWARAKIDAMAATRFDRTVFLDADVVVLAGIADLFALLDRFDIAAAHDQETNSEHSVASWRLPFPAAFPQYNTGVIAYRREPDMLSFLREWSSVVRGEAHARDQPAFRELLWHSRLRVATLPAEYNYSRFEALLLFRSDQIAPRILHDYLGSIRIGSESLGPGLDDIAEAMLASDRYLARDRGAAPIRPPLLRKRLLQMRAAIRWGLQR